MVEKEYSNALLELALETNSLDEIKIEFSTFIEALNSNPDFLKVLTFPGIDTNKKKESLSLVLKGSNAILLNFLYVLVDNGRIGKIFEIYESFVALLDNRESIVNVTVKSAHKLTNKQLADLEANLHNIFKSSSFKFDVQIDEKLLGGILVSANGKEIDFSLASKLNKLKNKI